MGYIDVTQGVTISVPTSGTRNWAQNLLTNAWQKLSSHDHTGSGKGKKIGTAAIELLAVTSELLAKNLAFTQANPVPVTTPGNTATIDFNNGNIQQLSLAAANGTVTVTLSNPQAGAVYKIWITQHGTAVKDITWPVNVLWPQGKKYGQDPLDSTWVPQNPGDLDCVTLYYNGTNYLGDWQLNWS